MAPKKGCELAVGGFRLEVTCSPSCLGQVSSFFIIFHNLYRSIKNTIGAIKLLELDLARGAGHALLYEKTGQRHAEYLKNAKQMETKI